MKEIKGNFCFGKYEKILVSNDGKETETSYGNYLKLNIFFKKRFCFSNIKILKFLPFS